jgi:hypothetical protein
MPGPHPQKLLIYFMVQLSQWGTSKGEARIKQLVLLLEGFFILLLEVRGAGGGLWTSSITGSWLETWNLSSHPKSTLSETESQQHLLMIHIPIKAQFYLIPKLWDCREQSSRTGPEHMMPALVIRSTTTNKVSVPKVGSLKPRVIPFQGCEWWFAPGLSLVYRLPFLCLCSILPVYLCPNSSFSGQ